MHKIQVNFTFINENIKNFCIEWIGFNILFLGDGQFNFAFKNVLFINILTSFPIIQFLDCLKSTVSLENFEVKQINTMNFNIENFSFIEFPLFRFSSFQKLIIRDTIFKNISTLKNNSQFLDNQYGESILFIYEIIFADIENVTFSEISAIKLIVMIEVNINIKKIMVLNIFSMNEVILFEKCYLNVSDMVFENINKNDIDINKISYIKMISTNLMIEKFLISTAINLCFYFIDSFFNSSNTMILNFHSYFFGFQTLRSSLLCNNFLIEKSTSVTNLFEIYDGIMILKNVTMREFKTDSIMFIDKTLVYLERWRIDKTNNIQKVFENNLIYRSILVNHFQLVDLRLLSFFDSTFFNYFYQQKFELNNSLFENINIFGHYLFRICCSFSNFYNVRYLNVTISKESISETTAVIFILYFDYKSIVSIKKSKFLNTGFTFNTNSLKYLFDYCVIFGLNLISLTLEDSYFKNDHFVSLKNGFIILQPIQNGETILKNNCFIAFNKSFNYDYPGITLRFSKKIRFVANFVKNLMCPQTMKRRFLQKNGVISFLQTDSYEFSFFNNFVEISNSVFENCNCENGGSINILNYHSILMRNVVFINSSASTGGSISIISSSFLILHRCFVFKSTANFASAIFLSNIIQAKINYINVFNSISFNSSVILLENIKFSISKNMIVENCFGGDSAGSLYVYMTKLYASKGIFKNNAASIYGGSFFLETADNFFLIDISIINTNSEYGAALQIDYVDQLIIKNLNINASSSGNIGGAILVFRFSAMIIDNLKIENSITLSTGIIYIYNINKYGMILIKKLSCINNFAAKGSCLIFQSLMNLTIEETYIFNCTDVAFSFNFLQFNRVKIKKGIFENIVDSSMLIEGNNLELIIDEAIVKESSFLTSIFNVNLAFLILKGIIFQQIKFSMNITGIIFELSSCKFKIIDSFFTQIQNAGVLLGYFDEIIFLNTIIQENFINKDNCFTLNEVSIVIKNSKFLINQGFIFLATGSNFTIIKTDFLKNVDSIILTKTIEKDDITRFLIVDSYFFTQSNVAFLKDFGFLAIMNSKFQGSFAFNNQALKLQDISYLYINNSNFSNFNNEKGSCIQMIDSNINDNLNSFFIILIHQSIFLKNQGNVGSAIFIEISLYYFLVNLTIFDDNKAFNSSNLEKSGIGGGLVLVEESRNAVEIHNTLFNNCYADFFGSTIVSLSHLNYMNVTFIDNFQNLRLEQNFISFPFKIELDLFERIEIVSGMTFNLSFYLADSQGNLLFYDNLSYGNFLSNDSNITFERQIVESFGGNLSLYEIMIKCPSSFNFSLIFLVKVFNYVGTKEIIISKNIEFKSRPCVLGQIIKEDLSCISCPKGTFSFIDPNNENPKTQKCLNCPIEADCYGLNLVYPKYGFWRKNNITLMFFNCPIMQSCIGYIINEGEKNLKINNFVGNCFMGHEGNLCFNCEKGYGRIKHNDTCSKCENIILLIAFITVGSVLAVYLYLLFNSYSFVRIKKKKTKILFYSLLVKMLINYLQSLSLITVEGIKWPYNEVSILYDLRKYSALLESSIYNNNCVLEFLNIQKEDYFITKFALIWIFPIFLWLIVILTIMLHSFYLSLRKCKKRRIKFSFSKKMKMSVIITLFYFYPSIISNSSSLMDCIQLEEKTYITYLCKYPDVICWKGVHSKLFHLVGLPSIILWGLAFPFSIYYILVLKKTIKIKLLKNSKLFKLSLFLKEKKQTVKKSEMNNQNPPNIQEINSTVLDIGGKKLTSIQYKKKISIADKIQKNLKEQKKITFENDFNFFFKKQEVYATSYLFFTQGYKAERNYWDSLIFLKKLMLIMIVSLTQIIPHSSSNFLTLFIFFGHLAMNVKFKPFLETRLNFLENISILATIITNISVAFLSSDSNYEYAGLFAVTIVISNTICIFLFFIIFFKHFYELKKNKFGQERNDNTQKRNRLKRM